MEPIKQRFVMTDVDHIDPSFSLEDRQDAAHARYRSAVHRATLPQAGLSRYNFRSLTRATHTERAKADTEEKARINFLERLKSGKKARKKNISSLRQDEK